MTVGEEIDLLLVGTGLEPCLRAAERDGLAAEIVGDPLHACVRVAQGGARVVVLSSGPDPDRDVDAIRALKEDPRSPAVVVTMPLRPNRAMRKAANAIADETIPEPFLPGDLLGRVRLLLARRTTERERKESSGGRVLAELLDDLGELNRRVGSPEELKDSLLRSFMTRSRARRASLLGYVPPEPGRGGRGHLVLERAAGLPTEIPIGTQVALDDSIAGRVATSRRPLLVRDFGTDAHQDLANAGTYATASCLVLPLLVGERLLGVVNLADKEGGDPFDDGDLRHYDILAGHAAQVLANARRLELMTRLSILDDLTGLYNRRFFRRSLNREFQRAVRYERPITLAILDLDHFKVMNDKNGHEAGNLVLTRVGEILRGSFRNTDIVARYGGEEFAVILPEIEKGAPPEDELKTTGAFRVLERLRASIESEAFEGQELLPGGTLTISGGAASFPADARTVEELLDAADGALYSAKSQGRNRIVLAG